MLRIPGARAGHPLAWAVLGLALALTETPRAGVTNPDISAIGNLRMDYNPDHGSEGRRWPDLYLDESEVVFDAALNPYARGLFVFSYGDGSVDVEEAYATFIQGLPWGLNLKAGKYRAGFGKLNPLHPHAYPTITTPRVVDPRAARLLPGDESFNETGLDLSELLPLGGDWASTVSADFLRGTSFHPDSQATRPAWLLRWSNNFPVGDKVVADGGLSATQGVTDVPRGLKATILGADAKAKLYFTPTENLTLQAEGLYRVYDDTGAGGETRRDLRRYGWYGLADFRFWTRWDAGGLYQQYQDPDDRASVDRSVEAFAGFAVLEESTLLRLGYEFYAPGHGRGENKVLAQLLFSMGPHKAHQF